MKTGGFKSWSCNNGKETYKKWTKSVTHFQSNVVLLHVLSYLHENLLLFYCSHYCYRHHRFCGIMIREFKIWRLRTTNYGWTSIVVCL